MTGFAAARHFLLEHRTDYQAAYTGFQPPAPVPFNWALDWFDAVLATDAAQRDRPALLIDDPSSGEQLSISFAAMAVRSNQAANFLRGLGVARGDRILLLLGNIAPLWELMLAAMKLGAVVIPATVLLTADELRDRVARGGSRFVVTTPDQVEKYEALGLNTVNIVVDGGDRPGWTRYAPQAHETSLAPAGATQADDPLLLYFTSGTTAKPKLVLHSHYSYPVGSLSTMYWIGLQPGDIHLNISSPGWAKHAWSSFFAPWSAGATICIVRQIKFDAPALLAAIARCAVTTLCAPPTVWRHLVQHDLRAHPNRLREIVSAGEPLNPEIIEQIRAAWGITIRDGYGQTETTAQIGNPPGAPVKPGAMGRPLPGYRVELRDGADGVVGEGEVALVCTPSRPLGLMRGYLDPATTTLFGADQPWYRTGDVATIDADGYLTFVGRADDVFKSSDYRISPFELESVLIEHPSVAEAAVVPRPDAVRLAVPVAYVALIAGAPADATTARSIFAHLQSRVAPFKRIRALVFVDDLPKTISGKIRRVQLRADEVSGSPAGIRFDESILNDPPGALP
ncbi:AMP-binding protein [Acidiphilium sp. PA]|uniref:AMP-binding protein n=1 Tax=Acidiphilium sp. PA TaxID=2871705 RepID=UPI0022439612|nr:AMP-binding protein [Acidiphilium sp. PA]MCW8306880.1 AMP-binding protein [Acidiphilium sp. PA]